MTMTISTDKFSCTHSDNCIYTRSRSIEGHYWNNLGNSPVSDATYSVSRPSVNLFRRKRFQ